MTDILERARAALDGVTEGPWVIGPVDDCRIEDADGNEVAQIDGDYNQPDTWPLMEANARFIAAARQLVPEMAAEIERLRDALAHTAEQALAAEIPRGYGPENKALWTLGYNAAIRHARKALEAKR